MSEEKDFNKVVSTQLSNMIAIEADYSEIIVRDKSYELSVIIKKIEEVHE